jgi:hypothetical protein
MMNNLLLLLRNNLTGFLKFKINNIGLAYTFCYNGFVLNIFDKNLFVIKVVLHDPTRLWNNFK